MTAPTVGLVNPLPRALAHYTKALTDTLEGIGAEVRHQETVSVEVGGNLVAKVATAMTAIRERRSLSPRQVDKLLILWPAFGYLDLLLWRARGTDAAVIVHDPLPLRPQFGLSRPWATAARLSRSRPEVVVHSIAAKDAVRARGIGQVTHLPHPMFRPTSQWAPTENVTVLGQFKPSRDLDLLPALATELRARGFRPVIKGSGWPPIPGWDVDAGFLTEAEFDEALRSSACVLLPYKRLYQSGVAVRAGEMSVPVVGPRASNLPWLFGERWPGLIDPADGASSWARQVEVVTRGEPGSVLGPVLAAYDDSLRRWGTWVRQ